MKLIFFVYSTLFNSGIQISYTRLNDLIVNSNYEIDKYKENNKEFYKIPVEDIW